MKKLFKILALWFVKISGINLIEPYTLEHLKQMIHSVNDDYSTFKYKPFLLEIKAINEDGDIKLYIPFLLDCVTEDDAKSVASNIRNSIEAKGYYTKFDEEKNIHTKIEEIGLLNDDFKAALEKMQLLSGFKSFFDKVEDVKKNVKNSQYYLQVDLLSGITKITQKRIPITSAKHNYSGLQIQVEEIGHT